MAGELLPIKVVTPRRADYSPGHGGGGTKIFAGSESRESLLTQLDAVSSHFQKAFSSHPGVPGVAKVGLKNDARAKSHRPTTLFNPDSCPIIGGGGFGELYLSVTPTGLDSLRRTVEHDTRQKLVANMSTISRIAPYDEADVLEGTSLDDLQPPRKRSGSLRLQLFRHTLASVNKVIDDAFRRLAQRAQIPVVELIDYAEGVRVFHVARVSRKGLVSLASFPGTQGISKFPQYHVVRTASRTISDVSATAFPSPKSNRGYGLVGMIDSGTDPDNPHLQAWVVERKEWVNRKLQDNEHGSFVAGLIVHGQKLNHGDPRFPDASSKIVDIVAFDESGEISERELILVIDDALRTYPQVKIWNLSIALDGPACTNKRFSLFASHLDSRARKHGVLFVIAAGNYSSPPFRGWPPNEKKIGNSDRIRPPADGLRVLTIGSRAHLDNNATVVKADEPSPFTRRGPAAAYIIKPELVSPGGNCDKSGDFMQTGVISLDGTGHVAESIGTSFACPSAASLAANVYRELDTPKGQVSPALVRGLMIHSAFMRNNPLDIKRVYYDGFGYPGSRDDMLHCTQTSATVILHVPLHDDEDFVKEFPMPHCLKVPEAGLRGEVFMTLAYDPPLGARHGFEYARSNVNASLGTVEVDPRSGEEINWTPEVHPTPKITVDGWEEDLVRNGYKWSPTKLYYREFTRGPMNKRWRLKLSLLHRSGFVTTEPQDVVLIVTVRDHVASGYVYDGMVREMNRLGWDMQDLPLRSRVRQRGRT